MKASKPSCTATTTTGRRCQAAALPDSAFCFFHDPTRATDRHDARVQGGRNGAMKTLADTDADVLVADSQDVIRLLSGTINQVRKGQLDPRVANAVGYLANVLLKAVDQGRVEDRLAALEAVVRAKRPIMMDIIVPDIAS